LKYGQQSASTFRWLGHAVNEESLAAISGWIGGDPPIRGERLDRTLDRTFAGVRPGGARGPFLWIGLRRGGREANRFIAVLRTMNGLASPIKEDNSLFIVDNLSAWKRNLSSGPITAILHTFRDGNHIIARACAKRSEDLGHVGRKSQL